VTLVGAVTPLATLSLDRATTSPPAGAALEMATVPVELVPPVTVVGLSVTLTTVGAVTVSTAVLVVPPSVADIVAVTFEATGVLETVNVPVV